jgi:hypothetical protein
MTFARLLLEIRCRAANLPKDLPRSTALEQAACEVLGTAETDQERDRGRQILAALLGIRGEQDFDLGILDALTGTRRARGT